jgi:hypothetical protein
MSSKGNQNASKYNENTVFEVCQLVADGANIKDALKVKKEYPTFETWRTWKRDNPFVSALYVGAIQDKAESVDQKIDQIMDEVHDGTIEPAVANVMMQTLKWKAAKYYPKMFGDSKAVDITTNGESLKAPIDWTK